MLRSIFKILAVCMVLAIMVTAMVGCGKSTNNNRQQKQEESQNNSTENKTEPDEKIRIGYIVNFAAHEFYKNIIKGQRETAEKLGIEIDVVDANQDIAKQISAGENLLAKKVDALIITPVDAKGVMPLIEQAMKEGIPVITESVKAEKQTCYVGIDDFQGGYLDGKYAGEYIKNNNLETPKALLVGLPALEACVNRTEGFKKGLLEVIPEAEIVAEVDGQGAKDKAMAVATDALTAHPDINMIMGINDDSTLGAVQAYKAAGMDISKLAAFGFGVEGNAAKNELADSDSPYQGGLAMFPENIGKICVEMAVKAVNGEDVPSDVQVPFDVMNKKNVNDYYQKDGDEWMIKWEEVEKLSSK
ncbi:MAG: substrate-binding domain-containing protein [Acetivibrionales bacterium]